MTGNRPVDSAAYGTVDGNVAGNGALELRSCDGVVVLGAVTFANAAAITMTIAAVGAEFIDAALGSPRLGEGSGHCSTLALSGSRVLAESLQALTHVTAASSTGAITTHLSANDGVPAAAKLLEVGALRASVARGYYVQHTALPIGFDDRRGLVGNSHNVIATGNPPITIATI